MPASFRFFLECPVISGKIVVVYRRQSPLINPRVVPGEVLRIHPTEPIPMKRKKSLEYKHHKFLMESREQADPEWVKTNKELEKRAAAGEDEAFFQLLERNPEYLKTDLAMGKIMEWQYAIRYWKLRRKVLLRFQRLA